MVSDGTTHLVLSPTELIEKLAALTEGASIHHYLEGVGLPARPPPIAAARPHRQTEIDYAAG